MRYIRTKDGIYSYEPTHNIDVDGFVVQHNLSGWDKPIMKEDIIKQADTIAELCDKFVLCDEDMKRYRILERGFYYRFDEESKKALHTKNIYIYGAIWTDKGLIYVAKMNDKGELELL